MSNGSDKVAVEIQALVEPFLESEGLALIDVEYRREPHGRTLRVVIDKEGGVTSQDCAMVSGHLGDLLDAKLDLRGPYHLEVSSPGLERPLTKLRHFVHFTGRQVRIRTKDAIKGRVEFEGVLAGVSKDVIILKAGNGPIGIFYDQILKARLTY